MKIPSYQRLTVLSSILFTFVIASCTQAQAPKEQFVPRSGQAGKDVVWVPTPDKLVQKMLDLGEVTEKDYVIDLGSGDGRTVIAAAKRGARALGIEYNPDMVKLSIENAKIERISDKAKFIEADLFETDFSEATVITMFLLPSLNIKLRPIILDLKPGTRIVSNTFDMEDWEPDGIEVIEGEGLSWNEALLWIVPAKVEGTWQMTNGTMTFEQTFQEVYGLMEVGGSTRNILDGRLRGDQISFSIGKEQYAGRVAGNIMEGTVTSGNTISTWRATLITN